MSDYQKMHPEFKAEWVAALRSGDYKQGTGKLRKEANGELHYCCLGVAADLLHPGKWERDPLQYVGYTSYKMPNGLSDSVSLLERLRQEISLSAKAHNMLACLNDKHLLSLLQIADWIEENL